MKILNVEIKRPKISLLQLAMVFGLLLLGSLQPVQAQTTTFAQFNQRFATNGFCFNNNAPNLSGTLTSCNSPGGVPIEFTFLGIPGLDASLQGNQLATLFIESSTTTPALPGAPPNGIRQNFQTVIIQILRDSPAPVGAGTRRNLLTVTVTTGTPRLDGNAGANSAGFSASTPGENVTFTSDFLDFSQTTARNFALSFSSITPPLSVNPANGFLSSFSAAGTGTFASSPRPIICCITTPAPVGVSGRVIAPNGRGLSNATVTMVQTDGTVRTTRSTSMGYYRFSDISAGQTVILTVASKKYNFQPAVVNLVEDVEGLNLLSAEPGFRKSN